MPGALMHVGAAVTCAHGGPATPTAPYARVTLGGRAAITVAASYSVAYCNLPAAAAALRCVAGQWLSGSTRVFAGGRPLALDTSPSLCVPNGAPLLVLDCQSRVTAI
ncbi:hypothetical protein LVB77_10530 [Lysobacter sp. 5GHs7-4]|uniref:hypothetical protein n=1 Tax=Lysobacter sp. 5GHs7-4 TaxID=2904253 RepID=UPI001E38E8A7|nr:hypothetical protein [Lysobacter sp. 5GHs7-4]UHQ25075.1 hypothetical protein LVB77_10530 [Lysobacter sp. 5GHs7-4]